jgi:hypothetical protein
MFTEIQKKVLRGEIEFVLKNNNAVIEEIDFEEKYAKLMCLIPIDVSIKEIFNQIVLQCNELGNFLDENFIVTNVKKMSNKELQDFINKSEENNGESDIQIDYS